MSPVPPNSSQWDGNNNNYLASVGTSTNAGTSATGGHTTGVFNIGGRSYGIQHITDGSSNTIAFGESLVGAGRQQQSVKWRDGPATGTPMAGGGPFYDANQNVNAVITDLQNCQNAFLTEAPNSFNDKGGRWVMDEMGETLFDTIVPPNSNVYSFACCFMNFTGSGCDGGTYQNTSSNHPGGANFLFGDGSVHFLKSSISMRTYWALGTKANGEVISSDQY
jgi:prepilin-type processing-associated H-X9-DG protein